MPVLIPLALNTGFYIEYLIRRFKYIRDKRETIPVYFNFGLIGLIGLAAPIIGFITLKNTSFTNWFHFFLISPHDGPISASTLSGTFNSTVVSITSLIRVACSGFSIEQFNSSCTCM